jgi:hypothetical protein
MVLFPCLLCNRTTLVDQKVFAQGPHVAILCNECIRKKYPVAIIKIVFLLRSENGVLRREVDALRQEVSTATHLVGRVLEAQKELEQAYVGLERQLHERDERET